MSNYFLGEVRPFGGNFAPQGWTMCNGQLLAISQNTALFALIGTVYGGDGITTFGLPDLRGRAMIHQGTGLGLSPRTLGEIGGSTSVTLLQGNLPAHIHSLNATATTATSAGPAGGNMLTGIPSVSTGHLYVTQSGSPPPTPTTLAGNACGLAGQSLPHENMMPSLTLTYIIALVGIFPSRN